MLDTFFMIHVDGGSAPVFRHYTLSAAITEAERLARLTNKKVHILVSLDWVKQGPLVWGEGYVRASSRLRLQ